MSKLIFTGYSGVADYHDPANWLKRIEAYTGILENLTGEHEIISIEHINYEGEIIQNGVQYYFRKPAGKINRLPFHLHRIIKRLQPDVVFINGFIFPLQIIQLRLTLGKNVKIIVMHRAEKPFTGMKKWFQKTADKCVDAYLFSSSGFTEQWKNNINTKKVYEVIQASSIFQMTDKTEARKRKGINGQPVFLWVGGLTPNKDPLTVVKAFLLFTETNPDARLYMIFQTEALLQAIRQILTNHPMAGHIILKGYVPHDALSDWFNSADYFISASHYEGSGVALSEAMSCGCIPITSDIISFKGMKGNCGFSFKAGDYLQLFSILENTVHIDVENERRKVIEQFQNELSFKAIAGKINKIINQI